jgi:ABC-type transport system involved in multi-copper enzyme maturation permease subunit
MIFLAALRKELLEQWRTYRLLAVGVVLVVFGLLSPLIAKYTPEIIKLIPNGEALSHLLPTPTAMDAVTQYIKNIGQFGVILALLLTMGAVAQEKDKGTAAMMLVKPLPRATFLVAKFTALALTFTATIAIAGAACYYYTWLLFGALDAPRWLALNGRRLGGWRLACCSSWGLPAQSRAWVNTYQGNCLRGEEGSWRGKARFSGQPYG